jgi:hypothetical protein
LIRRIIDVGFDMIRFRIRDEHDRVRLIAAPTTTLDRLVRR